jgi:hypothetical protein
MLASCPGSIQGRVGQPLRLSLAYDSQGRLSHTQASACTELIRLCCRPV